MSLVYSADRERRLRLVLGVGLVAGLLLTLLAAYILLALDSSERFAGVFAVVSGSVVLASTGGALRALPGRDRRARAATIAAGVVLVVVGLLYAAEFVGFIVIVIGIAVLTLAILGDDPDFVT